MLTELKAIPDFQNEDEERAFWATHDSTAYLDWDQAEESFVYLAEQLSGLDIVYLHVVDHSGLGAPAVPAILVNKMRTAFKNTFIRCGNYDRAHAEACAPNRWQAE